MRILGLDPGIATVGFGVVDTDKNRQTLVFFRIIPAVVADPVHPAESVRCNIRRLHFRSDDTQCAAAAPGDHPCVFRRFGNIDEFSCDIGIFVPADDFTGKALVRSRRAPDARFQRIPVRIAEQPL